MPLIIAPITVIIPCFRCKDTIEIALESVINQTLSPAEIILIDDESGDGTLDLLRKLEQKYAPIVKVLSLSKNSGPGIARNAGWEVAKQPWLAFLDADDIWHPQKLEIQWKWLQSNPNVALCGHATSLVTQSSNTLISDPVKATRLTPMQMLISCRLPTRSVMLRRDLPFRFESKMVAEDYLLWLEIIFSGFPAYRLKSCMVFSLRPEFSTGGYSGQLWTHEKRELAAFAMLKDKGHLSLISFALWSGWSYLKYWRRRWLMWRTK